MEKIKTDHPNHKNFKFIVEYCYETVDVYITAERIETDEEFKARQKRSESAKRTAKKRKAKRELEERELFEKLAKKYA